MAKKVAVRDRSKRPGTSVDQVYRTLYERIIAGVYPPRFKMSQKTLAEEFNVSRTPLREALNRLHAGGLLIADANRGMEVVPVDISTAEEGYAARLLLEPPLIASMIGQFDERDLKEMENGLEEMARCRDRNREFQEAHLSFHMVALQRYPKVIRDIVLSLYDQIHRHQRIHFSRPRIPEDFIDVDRLYLDAIRARDERQVRQLLEFHLIDASIGMTLDIDPDHVPTALILAAKGIGIEFDPSDIIALKRPIRLHWRRNDVEDKMDLATHTLLSGYSTGVPQVKDDHRR